MQKVVPFYTSVYFDMIPIEDSVIEHCYTLQKLNESFEVSNVGGWQSPPFKKDHNPILKPIMEIVENKVKDAYKDLLISVEPNLDSSWVNINKRGDYNLQHSHPGSYFSAVLYFQVPENSGNIVFQRTDDMRMWIDMFGGVNEENKGTFIVQPNKGMLIIFPAYVTHHVEQNLSNEDRISMAFNFR